MTQTCSDANLTVTPAHHTHVCVHTPHIHHMYTNKHTPHVHKQTNKHPPTPTQHAHTTQWSASSLSEVVSCHPQQSGLRVELQAVLSLSCSHHLSPHPHSTAAASATAATPGVVIVCWWGCGGVRLVLEYSA